MKIQIKHLSECQDHIPFLAKLWFEEISRHWVPDASIEKAKQRLLDHCNVDKLPLAIVALVENQPIGMACLRVIDRIRPHIAPWLGSLVVDPGYRSMKIGAYLIDQIKKLAVNFNYDKLHLLAFNPTIPEYYRRLGWEPDGYDHLLGHKVTCMKINL